MLLPYGFAHADTEVHVLPGLYFVHISAEMQLASARRTRSEDAADEDSPSTSGRQFADSSVAKVQASIIPLPLASIFTFNLFLISTFDLTMHT